MSEYSFSQFREKNVNPGVRKRREKMKKSRMNLLLVFIRLISNYFVSSDSSGFRASDVLL